MLQCILGGSKKIRKRVHEGVFKRPEVKQQQQQQHRLGRQINVKTKRRRWVKSVPEKKGKPRTGRLKTPPAVHLVLMIATLTADRLLLFINHVVAAVQVSQIDNRRACLPVLSILCNPACNIV